MTKVKIEDLKVFPDVAAVIGEARAKAELFKVQGFALRCNFADDEDLESAFTWCYTEQGFDFCDGIFCGVNPYAE